MEGNEQEVSKEIEQTHLTDLREIKIVNIFAGPFLVDG